MLTPRTECELVDLLEDEPHPDQLQENAVEELKFLEQPAKSLTDETDDQSLTHVQLTLDDGSVIRYLQPDATHQVAGVGDHTDLVPGVYEGGRKTWECSHLLLEYLSESYPKFDGNKNVLELGCGSGLPGLYCLLKGATVCFQDYNKDVLEDVTMPNVRLTCSGDTERLGNCKFFSGDWKHFNELMEVRQCKYDIILTSETIYSKASYGKIHNIFTALLAENGVIYVASKSHYFGVGGGVEAFKEYVKAHGIFDIETVYTTEHNLQCAILKLTKKS